MDDLTFVNFQVFLIDYTKFIVEFSGEKSENATYRVNRPGQVHFSILSRTRIKLCTILNVQNAFLQLLP